MVLENRKGRNRAVGGTLAVLSLSSFLVLLQPSPEDGAGHAEVRSPKLRAVIADNEPYPPVHRGGYSGVAELESEGSPRNLFVPAYAGLNFEHILSGDADSYAWSIFEPRQSPLALRRLSERRIELHQERTSHWPLETRLTYELRGDDAIDLTVSAVPRADAWRKQGWIGLFFASYIEAPEDLAIHWIGRSRPGKGDAAPRWIRHLPAKHGEGACHRPAGSDWDPPADPGLPVVLASGLSDLEYVYPFYYGVSHGKALIFCFEKPSEGAEARFAQSPSGGGAGNPAWDFLLLKRGYEVGKEFRFRMRAVCREFRGREDAVRAYEEWSGEKVKLPESSEPAGSGPSAGELRFRHHLVSRELPLGGNGSGDYGLTALSDLDQDGDLDFVLGGRFVKPERLYWFEFQGPDRWVQHLLGVDYRSDVGLAALDVDGDGWVDLVASGVWYGNPRRPREAGFERHVFAEGAGGAHDIVAHDMDGDGRRDLVLMGDARTELNGLVWYSIPADPTSPWERHPIGPAIHGAITPAGVADLDGDRDADVLRADTWFENKDGRGREWAAHANIPFGRVGPFGKCVRTAVADLDGDGKPEVVMSDADITDSRVAVLRNTDGKGGSWSMQELPRSFTYGSLHSLAVADLNGDRRPDVLVNEQEELLPAGRSNPRWVAWENLGQGQFAERIVLDARLGGHELQAGDVDADGDIDVCSKPWGARPDNGAGGRMHVDFLENLSHPRTR